MNIKKITDLPIGELGEENYVVADIDGEVKRVPAEDIGGGGGGLPPVTGSGKALVSIDGQWQQQEGYPYDEGETATKLFDETFTGFTRDEDWWIATVPLDSGIEFDFKKNYRVYIDGEAIDDAFVDGTYIALDISERNFVNIYEDDDGFIATANLYVDDYGTAPESMEIIVNEVVSGLHELDAKYVNGGAELEKAVETHGIGWYQNGWVQKIENRELELEAGVENWVGTTLLAYDTAIGTPVEIEFNGTLYNGRVHLVPYNGSYYVGFGNSHLIDPDEEDTGEPFCIRTNFDSFSDNWWVAESGTYTVDGWIVGKEKITIDEGYIPWYDAPEGIGLPEPTWNDGTYILHATESNVKMEYEWSKIDTKAMVVTYDDDTTETFNVLIQPE